jgi:hypothetical protein
MGLKLKQSPHDLAPNFGPIGQACKWALSNGAWTVLCYLLDEAASNVSNGVAGGVNNLGNLGVII